MKWWIWIARWFCVRYSDYIEYIIKNHGTLTEISPIHVSINRINNRLMFKIKEWYKLELKISERMKLLCSTKKLLDKTKKWIKCALSCSSWSSFSPTKFSR